MNPVLFVTQVESVDSKKITYNDKYIKQIQVLKTTLQWAAFLQHL